MPDLMDVYRCAHVLEADRAIVEVLEPAGIPAFRRDTQPAMFPAPDALPGAFFITVPAEKVDEARQLLAAAQADGVLDADAGEVIRS